jgi:uncharacterized protein YuzE
MAIAYDWPDGDDPTTAESYYTSDGDIAYIRVRSPQGRVTSEEEQSGLRDFDETGALVGLEVWSASKVLPRELVDALPRFDGRGTSIERQPA